MIKIYIQLIYLNKIYPWGDYNVKIEDPIKTTVEEIRKFLNIDNVIGETIETDEFLMFPVTRMGMGFGAGMGEGKGQE